MDFCALRNQMTEKLKRLESEKREVSKSITEMENYVFLAQFNQIYDKEIVKMKKIIEMLNCKCESFDFINDDYIID